MGNNLMIAAFTLECKRREVEVEQKGSDRFYIYKGGAEYLILIKGFIYEVYFRSKFVFDSYDAEDILEFIFI